MQSNTRDIIIASFNQLLHLYPFEKITIQMIIQQAGISKATFYRYFKDKQDVLCSNYDDILQKSTEKSTSLAELFANLSKEFSLFGKRLGNEIIKYLGDNNYVEYVEKRSLEYLDTLVRKNRNGEGLTDSELFQSRIVLSGISHNIALLSLESTEEKMLEHSQILLDMFPKDIRYMKFYADPVE